MSVSSGHRMSFDADLYHTLRIRNVLRFRAGLVFKAPRLCVSLNSGLESIEEEEDADLHQRLGIRDQE